MTVLALSLSKLGRAAVRYAELGWFVFPLQPRTKIPFAGTRGFQDATTNVGTVRAWWERTPDANIGLWPGPSGLTVLDLDGPDGEAAAQALGCLAEPTLEATTGRTDGGRHLYFRAPEFPVGNEPLAPKLDVRGQLGYVVAPPSIHPSGVPYTWRGTPADLVPLPPAVYQRLIPQHDPRVVAPVAKASLGEAIGEGGRNMTLAKIAGGLLRKHPVAEVVTLLDALNQRDCDPPLPRREVEAIVASLVKREAGKVARVTSGGTLLQVADDAPSDELPAPQDLASEQTASAVERGRLDFSTAPRWAFRTMRNLLPPLKPGDLILLAALMGNGKTSFLLSQLTAWAEEGIPVLYVPLELDADDVRRQWAAWHCGMDWKLVATNQWDALGIDAQDQHEEMLQTLATATHVQFPPPRRISVPELGRWVRWGVEHFGARVVIIDHFHRMSHGSSQNYRVDVDRAVRDLKDLARDTGVTILAAAQLNRAAKDDVLDRCIPPGLNRLKESSALAEEADVVLVLSRDLQSFDTDDELRAQIAKVRMGSAGEKSIEAPNTMVVTVRKDRLGDARGSVRLHVEHGRVTDALPRGLA